MHRRVLLFSLAWLATLAPPRTASAQTTPGPTIGPTESMAPERFANGADLGTTGSRPDNLTPVGISYEDCVQD